MHAAGNPHIQTDPRNIALVAAALGARLQQLDAANAAAYRIRLQDFQQRWQQAVQRWSAQAAPLKGVAVASQHKAFVYLYDWLGLVEVAVLEPKPGVEPSVAHLQQVLATLKAKPARLVVYAAYQDPRPSNWLQQNAGVPAVKLPFTVGGSERAKDLFWLFDDTLARLLAAGTPMNCRRARPRDPRPAVHRRAAGAGHACAAGHAGARPRHRVHRSGDRADRGPRRDRGRRHGVRRAGRW